MHVILRSLHERSLIWLPLGFAQVIDSLAERFVRAVPEWAEGGDPRAYVVGLCCAFERYSQATTELLRVVCYLVSLAYPRAAAFEIGRRRAE